MLNLLKALMFLDWINPASAIVQHALHNEPTVDVEVASEDAYAAILELAESDVKVVTTYTKPFNTSITVLQIQASDAHKLGLR